MPKCLSTLVAFIRLLAGMRSLMNSQSTTQGKSCATLFTYKWLLSSMRYDVCVKVIDSLETFLANVALIGSFSVVRLPMFPQRPRVGESFATHIAKERLLAGVDICVMPQILVGRKCLAAELAAEILGAKAPGLL